MDRLQTVREHMVIRETCGYDTIAKAPIEDLPKVLEFLNIAYNYMKLCALKPNL